MTMKKIKVLFILLILISALFYLFYREGSLPVNKTNTTTKTFLIKNGEPLDTIVNNLESEGFIRNKVIFYLIVKRLGIERKIQAGEFQLALNMDANEIANSLTHGTSDSSITLIEGMRKEEMAEIISKTLNIPSIEIVRKTNEGYIFPDTYMVPKNATFDTVYSIIKNNSKFIEALQNIKKK